jgi:hypothetical protein
MRIKLVGLALLAVFAIGAVGAVSASAAELTPFPNTFKISGKKSTFETKSGEKVVCEAVSGSGEVTTAKTGTATISFTECEAFGFRCKSKGAKAGEIVLKVGTEVVDINKAKGEVGNINKLTEELTIECTVLQKLKVKGATLCPITPVGKKGTEFTVTCKETKGVQEPTKYEGGEAITETKGEGLKTFGFEQSALEGTDTLTFAKEGEVKA